VVTLFVVCAGAVVTRRYRGTGYITISVPNRGRAFIAYQNIVHIEVNRSALSIDCAAPSRDLLLAQASIDGAAINGLRCAIDG